MFEEGFNTFAAREACVCMGKSLSYGELDEISRAFAAWLQSRGLKRGARVAIMMPNVLQYPVAIAGVLRAALQSAVLQPGGEGTRDLFKVPIGQGFAHTDAGLTARECLEALLEHCDHVEWIARHRYRGYARRIMPKPEPVHDASPAPGHLIRAGAQFPLSMSLTGSACKGSKTELTAVERHQWVIGQGRPVRPVGGGDAKKRIEQLADSAFRMSRVMKTSRVR